VDGYELRGPVRRDGEWDWIDFCAPGTGHRLAVDLSPASEGSLGQVLSVFREDEIIVLAGSYRAWFEQLVERYEVGRYFFREEDDGLRAYDRWSSDAEG
jgi:cell wall assembly regulator SMI1